jgi:glutamate racemase
MPNGSPRVLVFDSGLGGLTVAREIRSLIPQVELLYYADNAFFPYGDKPETSLLPRVLDKVLHLQQHFQPAITVLACNSASTLVLPHLRARTQTTIVGVVPAVKPAAETSNSGVIGLLATPGTVLRQYTSELIAQFADHCEVVSVGSTELARIAEEKLLGGTVSTAEIAALLAPFHQHPRATEIDTIVLACTHFPLLLEELQWAYGRQINWLDSGAAIARRVKFLLSERWELAQLQPVEHHRMLCSAQLPPAEGLDRALRELGFTRPQLLTRFAS